MLSITFQSLTPRTPLPITLRCMNRGDVPPHCHDFFEIVLVRQGSARHLLYDRDGTEISYSVIRGDVFPIIPGEVHSFDVKGEFQIFNLIFLKEALQPEQEPLSSLPSWRRLFSPSLHQRQRLHLAPERFGEIDSLCCKLHEELTHCSGRTDYHALAARMRFYEILIELAGANEVSWTPMAMNIDERLLKALSRLEKEPTSRISLARIAKESGMCYSGFEKKFKAVVGMTPSKYLLTLRLNRVREALLETAAPVSEIAVQCGFFDEAHLNKSFRRCYGATPSAFRRSARSPLPGAEARGKRLTNPRSCGMLLKSNKISL